VTALPDALRVLAAELRAEAARYRLNCEDFAAEKVESAATRLDALLDASGREEFQAGDCMSICSAHRIRVAGCPACHVVIPTAPTPTERNDG
jgi:hypothetical protein